MLKTESPLLRRYRQLVEVLAALARSSHGVTAVVQAVHQQVGTLFPAQVTLLALLKTDGDWRWDVYEGERRYTQHLPFYPEGILESVLNGEALSIPNIVVHLEAHPTRLRRVMEDGVMLDAQVENELPNQRALSMLYVPLEVQGERAGVLSIQSYEPGAFDDTDLEFLHVLANHISIALENAALREELERLTRTDALTGLYNRRAFYHDVPGMMETARREHGELSLVMLDVHEFKHINDEYGHRAGDAVLATVGEALDRVFSAPDATFRLSGDEFALLIWGDAGRLDDLATQLTHELRAAEWPGIASPICLQGGVARLVADVGLDEWLSLADARMYRAKRQRIMGDQVDWGLDFGDGLEHVRE